MTTYRVNSVYIYNVTLTMRNGSKRQVEAHAATAREAKVQAYYRQVDALDITKIECAAQHIKVRV